MRRSACVRTNACLSRNRFRYSCSSKRPDPSCSALAWHSRHRICERSRRNRRRNRSLRHETPSPYEPCNQAAFKATPVLRFLRHRFSGLDILERVAEVFGSRSCPFRSQVVSGLSSCLRRRRFFPISRRLIGDHSMWTMNRRYV